MDKLATLGLVSSLCVLFACSGGVEASFDGTPGQTGATRSLLNGVPDKTLETTSGLSVQRGIGWGASARGGWAAEMRRFDDALFAMNAGAEAALALEATGPSDRNVRVVARAKSRAGRVDVLLNGHLLGTVELKKGADEFEFVAPAPMWGRGDNELAFRAADPKLESAFAWGVQSVSVGPPERYDVESRRLDPGVSVTWDVLSASAGLLDVAARPAGAGQLLLEAWHLVPDAPRELFAAPAEPDETGLLRWRAPLPASEGAPLRITLTWAAAPGSAPLELERVVVFEDEPLPRPPVLFISVDTLAAQNMSLFGYDRETTPRLAERLGDFVTFAHARSNAPWTAPSYASQFSGLYVSSVRISAEQRKQEKVPFGVGEYRIAEQRLTLSELFAGRGYRTAAFVDNPFLTQIHGIRQGFELFDVEAAGVDIADHDMGAEYVFESSLEFLKAESERPPFVFAQVLDVHGPYFVMGPFAGTFSAGLDPGESVEVTERPGFFFDEAPSYITRARYEDGVTEVSVDLLKADYDEKVLEMDDRIATLLDELDAAGLYDRSLIVITADHGEGLGDHGTYFRHGLVYESQIHVPLLVKLPGQLRGGTRVDAPVQLVDLMPTFAEVLGVPLVGPHHGRSLIPLLEGAPDAGAEPVILSEASTFDHRALIAGRWKLVEWTPSSGSTLSIISSPHAQRELYALAPDVFVELLGSAPVVPGGEMADAFEALAASDPELAKSLGGRIRNMGPRYELYDIRADPLEEHDLAAVEPAVVEELAVRLHAELERAVADRFHDTGGVQELSAETKAHLEALGYVDE